MVWEFQIEAVAIFLIIFRVPMKILFTIKLKVLFCLQWTEVLLNVLTNEITVVTRCWAHNPISLKHVSSRSSFSRSTSSHTSLKYRCLSKVCNWIRPAYLSVRFCEGVAWLMWIVFADDQKTSSVCPGGCNSWKCSVWLQHSDQQVWGGDQKGNWPLYHRSSEYTASGGIYNG